MSMVKEQWEFVKDVSKLIRRAEDLGITLTFGEAYRTHDQQLLNYFGYSLDIGEDHICLKKRRKTSWTMNSFHLKRLAIDFNFFIGGKLTYRYEDVKPLGDFWESLNEKNRWGGNFSKKDVPHFERKM